MFGSCDCPRDQAGGLTGVSMAHTPVADVDGTGAGCQELHQVRGRGPIRFRLQEPVPRDVHAIVPIGCPGDHRGAEAVEYRIVANGVATVWAEERGRPQAQHFPSREPIGAPEALPHELPGKMVSEAVQRATEQRRELGGQETGIGTSGSEGDVVGLQKRKTQPLCHGDADEQTADSREHQVHALAGVQAGLRQEVSSALGFFRHLRHDGQEVALFQQLAHFTALGDVPHVACDGPELQAVRRDQRLEVAVGHQTYDVTGLQQTLSQGDVGFNVPPTSRSYDRNAH